MVGVICCWLLLVVTLLLLGLLLSVVVVVDDWLLLTVDEVEEEVSGLVGDAASLSLVRLLNCSVPNKNGCLLADCCCCCWWGCGCWLFPVVDSMGWLLDGDESELLPGENFFF